jgi:crotonobetainyl-CoA:carnitine CoA-transferase CaiB-like acyl-CoA transferase
MQAVLATQPASYWVPLLDAAQVPSGVVKTVLQALEETGSSASMGIPSSVGGVSRREPPTLDQHGAAVRESGWGAFRL